MRAVEAGDAGRFLAAMLQRVEAERDEARGVVGAPDAENAAFLAQLVVVERIGGQHGGPRLQLAVAARHIGASAPLCRLSPEQGVKILTAYGAYALQSCG